MAIDRSAAEAATSSLQSLPFGNIIGGPLVACVEAQAQAARTSWEFIQNVRLYADGEEKKTVNVSFQFIKDGRMAQITVPLLTIVPIPYIALTPSTSISRRISARPPPVRRRKIPPVP